MYILPTLTALLLAAVPAHAYVYCTFYGSGSCTGEKSVAFSVTNSNCFKASGKSFKCSGSTDEKFKLIQSPNNNDKCDCQSHCRPFSYSIGANFPCQNLHNDGYNGEYITYRFISSDISVKCGPNNC